MTKRTCFEDFAMFYELKKKWGKSRKGREKERSQEKCDFMYFFVFFFEVKLGVIALF